MSLPDPSPATRRPGNGRRTALIIVLVAFVASATTAMLAFTASHRARKADAAAWTADKADLRNALATWQQDVAGIETGPGGERARRMLGLPARTASLAAWKPRTPCGEEARNRLGDAMHARVAWLERRQAGQSVSAPGEESRALDDAVRNCDEAAESPPEH